MKHDHDYDPPSFDDLEPEGEWPENDWDAEPSYTPESGHEPLRFIEEDVSGDSLNTPVDEPVAGLEQTFASLEDLEEGGEEAEEERDATLEASVPRRGSRAGRVLPSRAGRTAHWSAALHEELAFAESLARLAGWRAHPAEVAGLVGGAATLVLRTQPHAYGVLEPHAGTLVRLAVRLALRLHQEPRTRPPPDGQNRKRLGAHRGAPGGARLKGRRNNRGVRGGNLLAPQPRRARGRQEGGVACRRA